MCQDWKAAALFMICLYYCCASQDKTSTQTTHYQEQQKEHDKHQKTAIKKDNKKQTLCQCCSDLEATIPWSAWLYSSSQDSPRGGDGSEDSSVLLCVVFWQNHCFVFASLQSTYFKHKTTTTTDKVKEDHDWNKPTPTQPRKTHKHFSKGIWNLLIFEL